MTCACVCVCDAYGWLFQRTWRFKWPLELHTRQDILKTYLWFQIESMETDWTEGVPTGERMEVVCKHMKTKSFDSDVIQAVKYP